MMKPFSLLIKPAGADCNLKCAYCFYRDRAELYPQASRHRMSDTVLERVVASYMAAAQPQHTFGWQGGEPTLMGVDFFRRVVELQQKHGRPGSIVGNGLQTNGTLIDDEFAAHLAKYKFLVGLSIDGPPELHDGFRTNAAGRGSHADVLCGLQALRSQNVAFNALVLVNSSNVHAAGEVFDYLRKDLDVMFHQYIPCVEFDADATPRPWTITGAQWGQFLCELFDRWMREPEVSVRLFDSVIEQMLSGGSTVCHMGRDCRQYFVVEHNGDVYPCDFFVEAGLKLGNIMETGWPELLASPAYEELGRRKSLWNAACGQCEFVQFCAGDCLKHRLRGEGGSSRLSGSQELSGSRSVSWLCEGWRQFYRHALPVLRKRADEHRAAIERARQAAAPARPPGRLGRNDPCPCGSGRKFKKCCGR